MARGLDPPRTARRAQGEEFGGSFLFAEIAPASRLVRAALPQSCRRNARLNRQSARARSRRSFTKRNLPTVVVRPIIRRLIIGGCFAYLVFLLGLTLLILPTNRPPPNLIPFRSMQHDWRVGGWEFVVNFLGNLGAFLPFGLSLPILRARPTRAWHVALACASLSAAIEFAQYLSGRRVADVDDVLLNTTGGLLGYGLYLALARFVERRNARRDFGRSS